MPPEECDTVSIHKRKTYRALQLAGILCLLPATAFSQGAKSVASGGGMQSGTAQMTMPTISKAKGLRSGDFVLTPAVALDAHHDTNVFNGNQDEPNNEPVAATSLRIMPRLGLNNGTDSEVQFNFAAAGDVRLYMSDKQTVDELSNFGGSADLGVTFAARRAISFTFFDHFTRALQANTWDTRRTLNRFGNDVGGRVSFHPGEIPERRPLEVSLIGAYAIDRFDDFEAGATNTVRTRLTSSWRFLPKTAVVVDASWDFRDFVNGSSDTHNLTADSKPWRVQAGLAGALTKKLTFRLTGGWGMSLHDIDETDPKYTAEDERSFNNFIGGAALGFRASGSTLLHIGYTRDFRDSYYANFVQFHRGSVGLNQRFGTMLDVAVWFNATYGTYGAYVPSVGVKLQQKNRIDTALDGGVRASFEVSRLMGMDIGYRYRGVLTSYRVSSLQDDIIDLGAYSAHEIFAGVTLRY